MKVHKEPSKWFAIAFGTLLLYPLGYDGNQLLRAGMEYFSEGWNWVDMAHIGMGYVNIFMQM